MIVQESIGLMSTIQYRSQADKAIAAQVDRDLTDAVNAGDITKDQAAALFAKIMGKNIGSFHMSPGIRAAKVAKETKEAITETARANNMPIEKPQAGPVPYTPGAGSGGAKPPAPPVATGGKRGGDDGDDENDENGEKKKAKRAARLPPEGTPERDIIEAARARGIREAMSKELENIRAGGKGSGVWSNEELETIRKTGRFPIDTRWHHDPTVANRPDLAGNSAVVRPVRGGRKGHLDEHGGDWRKPYPNEDK